MQPQQALGALAWNRRGLGAPGGSEKLVPRQLAAGASGSAASPSSGVCPSVSWACPRPGSAPGASCGWRTACS